MKSLIKISQIACQPVFGDMALCQICWYMTKNTARMTEIIIKSRIFVPK